MMNHLLRPAHRLERNIYYRLGRIELENVPGMLSVYTSRFGRLYGKDGKRTLIELFGSSKYTRNCEIGQ